MDRQQSIGAEQALAKHMRRLESADLARSLGMWSSLATAIVLALSMVVFALIGPWKDMATGCVAKTLGETQWT